MKAQSTFISTRVTRLGEFSPIWRLFSLDSFMEITVVAQKLGLLFPRSKFYVYILIWAKNGLGYVLCDFFTNSSAHPALNYICTYQIKNSIFYFYLFSFYLYKQGDQIGRILTFCVFVYFGQFFTLQN
jgi:hypothetical protein